MTRSSLPALIGAALMATLGGLSASAQDEPVALEIIDFGDDASIWSNDGECDDPRFEGSGMTNSMLSENDRGHDASDCRAAYEAGRLTFLGDDADVSAPLDVTPSRPRSLDLRGEPLDLAIADIDFGDDTSVWANDGECDDPRFGGDGVAMGANRDNVGRDAADCRAMMEAGLAAFYGELEPLFEGSHDGVDFGDNEGLFPGDDECDDPRFEGIGVAMNPDRTGAGHDAADCRAAYDAGLASYSGELEPAFEGVHDGVDFGDNSGSFPFDEECDDPRFSGDGVAYSARRADAYGDADDCRRAYEAGVASYDGELEPLFAGVENDVDYGDNSGPYVDDAECDDPRFSGAAVAAGAQRHNVRQDAHDCHAAVLAGQASYDGELEPLFEGVFEGVDFGDNDSVFADDKTCDDARFRGFGMAGTPWNEEAQAHDAADCQALFAKGFIRAVAADGLFEGEFEGVDFGDNSGFYVNDGECDDSRFEGPGMGLADGSSDRQDAMDCKTNFEEGSIILIE